MVAPEKVQCKIYPLDTFVPCDPVELVEIKEALAASFSGKKTCQRGTITQDQRLDMCKQNLGPEGLATLIPQLKDNNFIKTILLGTNGLGNEGVENVASIIQGNQKIETIYLGCNGITAEGIDHLGKAIAINNSIKSLWLKRNPIGDAGAAALAKHFTKGTNLRTLDLVHTALSTTGLSQIIDSLINGKSPIERLFLGANNFTAEIIPILIRFINQTPSLKELYLPVNELYDSGIEQLLNHPATQQLTTLGLGANGLTDNVIASINTKNLPNLIYLDLSNPISTKKLQGKSNVITDQGAIHFSNDIAHWKKIETINLTLEDISYHGAQTLIEAAIDSSSLKRLYLHHLNLTSHQITLLNTFHQHREAPNIPQDIIAIKSVYR